MLYIKILNSPVINQNRLITEMAVAWFNFIPNKTNIPVIIDSLTPNPPGTKTAINPTVAAKGNEKPVKIETSSMVNELTKK